MTIEVSCDCSMTYRLPDRFAGKSCRCRECGESISVPAPRAAKTVAGRRSPGEGRAPRESARIRADREPSDSLHQIEPLNMSDDVRISEPPPRARLRAKAGAAVAAPLEKRERGPSRKPGKKEARRAHDEKPENPARLKIRVNAPPPGKEGKTGRAGSPRKKSSPEGRALPGKKMPALEAPEQDGEGARRPTADEKRRRQVKLLAGSLAGAIVCIVFLVVVIVRLQAADEAARKTLETAHEKVASARAKAAARDWPAAASQYADTVAFVDKAPSPIEDTALLEDLRVFRGEKEWIDKIAAAAGEIETSPDSAFEHFDDFARLPSDLLRPAGAWGFLQLARKGHEKATLEVAKIAREGGPEPALRAAARSLLIEIGSKEGDPWLAEAVSGALSPASKQAAFKRVLDLGQNAPPALLLTILEGASEAETAVRALEALRRIGFSSDPRTAARTAEAVERRTHDPDPAVQKAAEEALPYVKGEKL